MARNSYDAFFQLARIEPSDALDSWFDASKQLDPALLETLASAFVWARLAEELTFLPRSEWCQALEDAHLVRYQSHEVLTHLNAIAAENAPDAFIEEVFWRESALARLDLSSDDHFANALILGADNLVAALSCIRDTRPGPHANRLLQIFPELDALRLHRPDYVTTEHESVVGAAALPILEHLVDRVLSRKLRGLEQADISIFQRDDALSQPAFDAEVAGYSRIGELGLLPVLRAALMFLDFSKGGTDQFRSEWTAAGADLSVHNMASAQILQNFEILRRFPRFRGSPCMEGIVIELVRVHGLTGQTIRGECPLTVFAPFIQWLRGSTEAIAKVLGASEGNAVDAVIDVLHLINVCDTAGVREGLFDDSLRFEFVAVENLLRRLARTPFTSASETEAELKIFEINATGATEAEGEQRQRQWLTDRLMRLRKGRITKGEPPHESLRATEELSSAAIATIVDLMCRCQFWYVEAATSSLSASAQLRILVCSLMQAQRDPKIDTETMFHVTFVPLVRDLDRNDDPAAPYRVRLIEALLRRVDIEAICLGADPMPDDALGSFEVELGGHQAHAVRFEASRETQALLTLLPAYEQKSSAAFHATLKALCDLYGLRKDEFDRISNESIYLDHMNSARSDKERMLDYAVPGCLVEIGPGGGVVLDLIEARFPDSKIVGVDVSKVVVESLQERREKEGRLWTVIEADAFELPQYLEPNSVTTIVLCSVLHEIYSYVEHMVDGAPRRFRLESVRDLLRACYKTLAPGGRIIIRDGIMPADEPRIIEFIDPEGPQFFRLFQEQFEGRPICGEWLDEKRVRLGAADAMEFLYCYTWGPASFPYEVREQYGILPYDDYQTTVGAWLSAPRIITPPEGEASYLQQGYIDGLAPKIRFYDGEFKTVALPDSNAILIFEKPSS